MHLPAHPSPPTPGDRWPPIVPIVSPFPDYCMVGVLQDVASPDWLLPLSRIHLRSSVPSDGLIDRFSRVQSNSHRPQLVFPCIDPRAFCLSKAWGLWLLDCVCLESARLLEVSVHSVSPPAMSDSPCSTCSPVGDVVSVWMLVSGCWSLHFFSAMWCWVSFHRLVRHLGVVFSAVSVQISGLFLNSSSYCWVVVFCRF